MNRRTVVRSISAVSIAVLFFASSVSADEPAPNKKYRAESLNKKFYLDMIPQKGSGGSGPGKGIAYRLGSNQKLWEIDWYARRVILSDDGKYLIRLGTWGSDRSGFSDLAVAFYREGREIKRYSIKDLIQDPNRLEQTLSHYFWQATESSVESGLSADGNHFTLILLDGSVYRFDVKTGEILSKGYDPQAKGISDLIYQE